MAHGRQELGFGQAGRFRRFLRLSEFRRAHFHLVFQMFTVARQLLIAGLNLRQHLVEVIDELTDFIVTEFARAQRVILILGNLRSRLPQRQNGIG